MVSVRSALNHMPYMDVRCYTDSQVALYWIRGKEKEWKPFVQNRVQEIRRNVHPNFWSHCPGRSNPADLPSRGLGMIELAVSQLWRCGPGWLSGEAPEFSSDGVTHTCMPEQCLLEFKKSTIVTHDLLD